MPNQISSEKKAKNFELWSLIIAKSLGRLICLAFAISELISLICYNKCNYYVIVIIITGLEITSPLKGLISIIKHFNNKKIH
jgi:hypothetical protein